LGRVKFGQTQPDLSNSGLMTLTLIAYSYFKKDRDLTPQEIHNDSGFRTFLKDIEDKVQCFGPSSGAFMPTVIRDGPGYFDFVTSYENLVLANEQAARGRWDQTMVMYYPPRLKMKSDHPFVILQGKWVSPGQQQAALAFLKFLKDPAQQQSALTFGLRPENLPITADVPGNLFRTNNPYTSDGYPYTPDANLIPVPQTPSDEALDALITLWQGLDNGDSNRQC
jgi:ABC-type sulfate transport system substrate-binding protein